MKSGYDVIPGHLRLLADKGDLLRQIYAQGSFEPAPDQQRTVTALLQANAVIETSEHEYRITRYLKRHLDIVLRRHRSYAVSEDLKAQIDALEKLASSIQRVALAGEAQQREDFAEEFDEVVFDVAQDIDSTLSRLRMLVDNRFADVASFEEKRAQNIHYIDRLEKLEDAMAMINDAPVQEQLENSPFLEEQKRTYRRELTGRLGNWRSDFLDIADTLREHIHNLRRIQPKAQMLRRLAFHLERDRNWVIADPPEDQASINGWALRAGPIAISPSADISDVLMDAHYRQISQSIPAAVEQRTTRQRSAGQLVGRPQEEEIEIEFPAWRLAIEEMVQEAKKQVVNADLWRLQKGVDMPRDLWFFATLDLVDNEEKRAVAKVITAQEYDQSGNQWIIDVELCPRH